MPSLTSIRLSGRTAMAFSMFYCDPLLHQQYSNAMKT